MRKTCAKLTHSLCTRVGTTTALTHMLRVQPKALGITTRLIRVLYTICTRLIRHLFIKLTSYISSFTHLPHSLYKQKLSLNSFNSINKGA